MDTTSLMSNTLPVARQMPIYGLWVKGDLENLRSVEVLPGATWTLDVTDLSGTEKREKVTLSAAEVFPIEGSRWAESYAELSNRGREHVTSGARQICA
jgi:hypothetical protein